MKMLPQGLLTGNSYPDMLPIQINSEVILHLLLDLKPNKAPGSNTICAHLLMELAYCRIGCNIQSHSEARLLTY